MAKRVRVGAYALIHDHDQGRVLLVQMGMGPFTGRWSLPGGGLDFAEAPLDGARREVREEVGVSLVSDQMQLHDVVSYKSTWHDPNKEPEDLHFVGVVYRAQLEAKNFQEIFFTGDGESTLQARWFSYEDINNDAVELSPIFERLIKDSF